MDKIDKTYMALVEFLRRPFDAGTTTVWPGTDHLMEGLTFADAYALAAVDKLARDAFMCHSLESMPSLVQPNPPHVWKCPGCAVSALRERLGGVR